MLLLDADMLRNIPLAAFKIDVSAPNTCWVYVCEVADTPSPGANLPLPLNIMLSLY